jgi:hypothetical protein
MGKIILSKEEKKQLLSENVITITRPYWVHQPKGTFIHGKGSSKLWDKIDRNWVFGDTNDYIKVMTNVGRRSEPDYKDNNTKWWECESFEAEMQPLTIHSNGRINLVRFMVEENTFVLSETQKTEKYVDLEYKLKIRLKGYTDKNDFINVYR